jgi:A20-like zinc finger
MSSSSCAEPPAASKKAVKKTFSKLTLRGKSSKGSNSRTGSPGGEDLKLSKKEKRQKEQDEEPAAEPPQSPAKRLTDMTLQEQEAFKLRQRERFQQDEDSEPAAPPEYQSLAAVRRDSIGPAAAPEYQSLATVRRDADEPFTEQAYGVFVPLGKKGNKDSSGEGSLADTSLDSADDLTEYKSLSQIREKVEHDEYKNVNVLREEVEHAAARKSPSPDSKSPGSRTPPPCLGGCGLFGSAERNGYCSKCEPDEPVVEGESVYVLTNVVGDSPAADTPEGEDSDGEEARAGRVSPPRVPTVKGTGSVPEGQSKDGRGRHATVHKIARRFAKFAGLATVEEIDAKLKRQSTKLESFEELARGSADSAEEQQVTDLQQDILALEELRRQRLESEAHTDYSRIPPEAKDSSNRGTAEYAKMPTRDAVALARRKDGQPKTKTSAPSDVASHDPTDDVSESRYLPISLSGATKSSPDSLIATLEDDVVSGAVVLAWLQDQGHDAAVAALQDSLGVGPGLFSADSRREFMTSKGTVAIADGLLGDLVSKACSFSTFTNAEGDGVAVELRRGGSPDHMDTQESAVTPKVVPVTPAHVAGRAGATQPAAGSARSIPVRRKPTTLRASKLIVARRLPTVVQRQGPPTPE